MSDEFRRIRQSRDRRPSTSTWVMTVATSRIVARFAQRILERLLEHVADPAGGARDKDSQWERRDFAACLLVPHQLVANLRAVAVHEQRSPAVERQIDDRSEAFARMSKLIGDGRPLARRRERVTPERNHCGAPGVTSFARGSDERAERIIGSAELLEIGGARARRAFALYSRVTAALKAESLAGERRGADRFPWSSRELPGDARRTVVG